MSRIVKQIVYGIFYCAVLIGLGFGVHAVFLKPPPPSCFDGIQNEGEQGIDCGGPCAQVCVADLSPIGLLQSPALFSVGSGRATIIAQVANANAGAGATDFKYAFSLLDASGTAVGSVPGETFLYPGQTRYLVAVNQAVATSAVSANFSITGSPLWVSSSTMGSVPSLGFQNVATAPAASGTIAVSGIVINQDPSGVSGVLLVALFKDSSGAVVGVSQTEIDSIAAGASANFTVLYPANPVIDFTKTEVDGYAYRE